MQIVSESERERERKHKTCAYSNCHGDKRAKFMAANTQVGSRQKEGKVYSGGFKVVQGGGGCRAV